MPGEQRGSILQFDSYDPRFFARIAQIEDRHFWFCARNRIIAAALRNVIEDLGTGYRVLEVGCGTGVVLRELVEVCRRGEVIGMDLYPEAVAFAGERAACEVVVGDVLKPPNLGRFDVIGMFDVLEHLSNDSQIAGGLNRMLKSDGILILTVPAHLSLWSYFDIASRHCRRYERCELTRIVEGNGFKIEYVTEFMMSLYPLMWVVRRTRYRHGTMNSELAVERADAELRIIPVVNGLLKAILTFEAFAVARRWRLPLGTSLLIVARKRESVAETSHSLPERSSGQDSA